MIIQCEQCRTKFKLDDSKVPDKGVKVRCVKCRYVFSVAKELPETEAGTDFESILDSSVSATQGLPEVQQDYDESEGSGTVQFEEEVPVAAPTEESAPLADSEPIEEATFTDVAMPEPAPIEFEEEIEEAEHELTFGAAESEEDQDLTFGSFETVEEQIPAALDADDLFPPAKAEVAEPAGDVDFGDFAFNDDSADDADATVFETPMELDFGDTPQAEPIAAKVEKDDFGGLDFSDDDMFGAVVAPAADDSEDTAAFDFGMDDFASSMGVEDSAVNQKSGFSMTDSSSDTPFSLDEIDFGDELTSVGVQHVNPEELKPSQELLFAPLAEAQSKPLSSAGDVAFGAAAGKTEDLPPLSIASRRKQSPLFTGLMAVVGVIVAGIVAIYGYSMFSGGKEGAQESGHISVRAVDASFVKNKLTGDLLVISGEAVNDFSKPRAAIQVKGMVYGDKGEVLASKTAFCGNPLTEEQLATMSMDKIEAAMANQFGDSLANMEVAPGKAIPFVIVITKPASGAKDYGVEPTGSTVAAVKQ